jgi:hypothetical protein
MHVYRAGMTRKLTEKTQELNAALLENIKKDSSIERLSEQLESKPFTLTLLSSTRKIKLNQQVCKGNYSAFATLYTYGFPSVQTHRVLRITVFMIKKMKIKHLDANRDMNINRRKLVLARIIH